VNPYQPAESAPRKEALSPWHEVRATLHRVGLRYTRRRVALTRLLFARGDRHVTAEMLHNEASNAKVSVSLATIYNTLHKLTEAGLLRQIAVDGTKVYFDTNTSNHHHFFLEDRNNLLDIVSADVFVGSAPRCRRLMRLRAST
jgi:Fur family transcriptional regulator, iron response regulator